MKKQDLRTELLNSLSVLYDTDALAPLVKFLQGELRVLYYLYTHCDKVIYISDLSEETMVSRSRVTALINALKKKDYIRLEHCEHDRRRISVHLTEKGASYTKEQQEVAFGYFDRLVDGFGEDNTAELIRLINLATEVMENIDDKE